LAGSLCTELRSVAPWRAPWGRGSARRPCRATNKEAQMIAAATIRCEDRAANVLVAKEDDVARAFLADNLTADG
jgi:hypothetical protein